MNKILLLKQIIPPIIWKMLKKFKKKKKYFALNYLDQKLEKYLNFENGYFVELGANDGISQSNTYYYEKYKKWSGILIEPILHKYIECKKSRSDKNKYYCNACVSFTHNKEFVKLLFSNLMTISTNLQSDINDKFAHANHSNTIRKNKEEVIEFFAKAKTLDSILIECDAPKKIDFLSVDVEGAEIEVLKGINFVSHEFKYILVESREIEKISNFLSKHNYNIIEKLSYNDYLFKIDK